MTAAEAAALIKNGEHIAMSGFTPAGVAKATTKELAKIAVAEHEAGREFKVAIFTGASTGQSTDGDLANAQAILYRAPYTTNPESCAMASMVRWTGLSSKCATLKRWATTIMSI